MLHYHLTLSTLAQLRRWLHEHEARAARPDSDWLRRSWWLQYPLEAINASRPWKQPSDDGARSSRAARRPKASTSGPVGKGKRVRDGTVR